MTSTRSLLDGVRAAVPVIMGYVPVGMTFGLLARTSGCPLEVAMGFSLFVFAGASQFMAVNLMTSGLLPAQIIAATFLLNFRHFLMSGSLARRLRKSPVTALVGFGVTDETFSVASGTDGPLEPAFLLGLQGSSWAAWAAGTLLGHVAGAALPERLQAAMGTALYALFVALLVPRLKARRRQVLPAAAAAALNLVLIEVMGWTAGWALVIVLLLVPALSAVVLREDET